MAVEIKLFSFNRKYYHLYGIFPPEAKRNGRKLNLRNWIFIASFVLTAGSTGAFFVFDAKSMLEFGISFFTVTLAILEMFTYLAIVWQMKNTWRYIEKCERFIEKSKPP